LQISDWVVSPILDQSTTCSIGNQQSAVSNLSAGDS
jgi:hypothetical protein